MTSSSAALDDGLAKLDQNSVTLKRSPGQTETDSVSGKSGGPRQNSGAAQTDTSFTDLSTLAEPRQSGPRGPGQAGQCPDLQRNGMAGGGAGGEQDGLDEEIQPLIPGREVKHGSFLCGKTNFYIYLSHFLSAWGDNMWTFAVGVFLVEIDGTSLQLTASFGMTMGVGTLLLGAVIGDWVDSMPRLRAAQEALLLQNVMIALCAGFVYNLLEFSGEIENWGQWLSVGHYVFIIVLGTAAYLAHIANTIAIERDWIVEICGENEDRLATMTATMRAIDLTAMIVAPIATGQVMTLASSKTGALFIAGWNVASFFVEYILLWKVYTSVPALQKEKVYTRGETGDKGDLLSSQSALVSSVSKSRLLITSGQLKVLEDSRDTPGDVRPEHKNGDVVGIHQQQQQQQPRKQKKRSCVRRLRRIFSGVMIIKEGWRTYAGYQVMLSGLSLALLYMTVLGFDNVTIGYAKMQCLTESEVGLMMGGAGLIGTFGTFMYPRMRRWLGLPWTGMVALTLQSATLSMCVVSVWLPGSPFNLDNPDSQGMVCDGNWTAASYNQSDTATHETSTVAPGVGLNLTSVAVLMAGIIAARFGLWIADLAITQMFLETVVESERGIVNGVQQSLNQFLDLVKFALVIFLPKPAQFGLLVILSFAFVFSGWILYLIFLIRVPKNLFIKKITLEV